MRAKKILFNLFSFLLFFLLVITVNAEGFIATSLPSVGLCPCSNQAYAVTVQNTGSAASSYTASAGGDAAEWVTFNPRSFVLNPGQKTSLLVFVDSICNIEGNFSLEIFIADSRGQTKVVRQILDIFECYDYSLEQGEAADLGESIRFQPHDDAYFLCTSEPEAIPILITNKENFGNRYRLFLDAPHWAGLSSEKVYLDAKESGIFLINLDKAEKGIFNLKLSAISELGKVQRREDIKLNVQECYALEVNFEREQDRVCSGENKIYDILLKNTGDRMDFDIQIDAPEWASLENISLHLSPEEEKTVKLNINPPDGILGRFAVNVFAKPENKTGVVFSDELRVDILPMSVCYKADIIADKSIKNFYAPESFFVKVRNEGVKRAVYKAGLDAPSWASISPDALTLNPGQTGNLNLNTNPNDDISPGIYNIKINLESGGTIHSKNIEVRLRKENEFLKKLSSAIKLYQYYFYLLIAIIILILVFIRHIIRIRNKVKDIYRKYRIRRARLMALRIARRKRKEEKSERKEPGKIKKKGKRALKLPWQKYKLWLYISILFIIVALGVFFGHIFKLFNAKYIHIYVLNFFYGYLYYFLIGIGIVIVLFLLILFYNPLRKFKEKKEIWYNTSYFRISILFLIGILVYFLTYFDIFGKIGDFFILYLYYFVAGATILIVIILLIRFYKPLVKLLRE